MRSPWVVHKFGGTSVAGAERYRQVAAIVAREPGERKAIVVSAMSGVTDRLIELVELARAQHPAYTGRLDELKRQHLDTARELLGDAAGPVASAIEGDARNLGELLRAVWLSRSASEQTLELIAGHGEIWSAQLLNAYLAAQGQRSRWIDAREALIVRPGETGPLVDWEASKAKLAPLLDCPLVVITGYVASTPEGVATTLKRNGSDFSASIFGSLLDASAITIWTDVDGVLSADPRRVPEAVVLDEMSYNEAVELAYFGAKVIHPHTMAPAMAKGIPLWIRNTLNPSHPGTKIHHGLPKGARPPAGAIPVKGFSTVDHVALINVEGTGMIGVPGVANRLFGSLREVGVSVILISQASSEHSICFAVPEPQGRLAKQTVEKAFFAELHHGQIQEVELIGGVSILAAVGDSMVHTPGISAKFFGALAKAGVNIRAIAQGSSERNISAVIDQAASTRALRAVHAGFYLSNQTISVGVIGPGLIGSALLAQLQAQAPALREQFRIDLRVRGLMSSRKMLLDEKAIDLGAWRERFEREGKPAEAERFAAHVKADHIPQAVIIDCTASEQVAALYPKWLERGIHVITPNKKANSGKLAFYRGLRELGRKLNTHYFYEATVGAGLPVITTLRDLIQTGDRVTRIEGVLSGTLSYLFNVWDGSKPFSAIVADAKAKGYTEPDPRDDLSGRDVARKLIILAREMGLGLELEQIAVESLVPDELRDATADEFLRRLPEFDARMEKLRAEAQASGQVLRYVGVVAPDGRGGGAASVRLERYPMSHSFARIAGSDNIIAFHSARYHVQPLIVQGPGAGPEVTAGGVFADLLRLCAYVGAPT